MKNIKSKEEVIVALTKEDGEWKITENNISNYAVQGIWAMYGNVNKEWECLEVGETGMELGISAELTANIKMICNSNDANLVACEGAKGFKIYKTDSTFPRYGKRRVSKYIDISKNYGSIKVFFIGGFTDLQIRKNKEAEYAMDHQAKYWYVGRGQGKFVKEYLEKAEHKSWVKDRVEKFKHMASHNT